LGGCFDENVFVLVAQRPEFLGKWTPVLSKRGDVFVADGLPGLQAKLQIGPPRAVVVDRLLLGETAPGFLLILKRLCGDACLLLGDTSYDASDELLALAAGVTACCDETLADSDIGRIVGIVLDGGLWISRLALPELADRLQVLNTPTTNHPAGGRTVELDALTQRQRDVAELVAQGESNKVIARRLNITDRTVKAHLTTIFEKLGLTDRLQLALFVTRRSSGD
jgi:DNA-binding NarL/FixJ family response regulator